MSKETPDNRQYIAELYGEVLPLDYDFFSGVRQSNAAETTQYRNIEI